MCTHVYLFLFIFCQLVTVILIINLKFSSLLITSVCECLVYEFCATKMLKALQKIYMYLMLWVFSRIAVSETLTKKSMRRRGWGQVGLQSGL